jgi:hypothetical protein
MIKNTIINITNPVNANDLLDRIIYNKIAIKKRRPNT